MLSPRFSDLCMSKDVNLKLPTLQLESGVDPACGESHTAAMRCRCSYKSHPPGNPADSFVRRQCHVTAWLLFRDSGKELECMNNVSSAGYSDPALSRARRRLALTRFAFGSTLQPLVDLGAQPEKAT